MQFNISLQRNWKGKMDEDGLRAGSNNSHLLPHLMQFKCSNGSEVLHLKSFFDICCFLVSRVHNKKLFWCQSQ